ATRLPRHPADSKISEEIPSAVSNPFIYCAAWVSLPGGLLVLILIRFTRMSAGSELETTACAQLSEVERAREIRTANRVPFTNIRSFAERMVTFAGNIPKMAAMIWCA